MGNQMDYVFLLFDFRHIPISELSIKYQSKQRRFGEKMNPSPDSIDDLKKMLAETGYSTAAIAEILKWYVPKEDQA